jgi:predicted transcriptional regulator
MKLNQYLVKNEMKQSEFAKELGVCQATVHKWMYSLSVPSGKRIMEIHKKTKGEVSVDDWIVQRESDGQKSA